MKYRKAFLIITGIVLLSSLVLYLPFILHIQYWLGLNIPNADLMYIYRHFDGLLYVISAKTWYDPVAISKLPIELLLPPQYFPAHLPGYPIFIALIGPIIGYYRAPLIVNLVFSVLLSIVFYFIIKKLEITKHPVALTFIFLMFPRFLVIRSVGAPESLFMLSILLSLYLFERKHYFWASLIGAFAVVVKTPGILLFVGFTLTLIDEYLQTKKFNLASILILLIPSALIGVFGFYWLRIGDFFAYFHTGGYVPMPYLFSVFNYKAQWVGTGWLEGIIFIFFLYGLSTAYLKDLPYKSFFYFSLVFLVAVTFVQHQDISRYSLPLWPLACIGLSKFFTSRKFIIIFLLLLPAIYMFAWNFMVTNVQPVANWAPYM
ncbi:MAG: hypothetical protein WCO06_02790 [Candidatus Roizmanbacteria bacterium]